MRNRIIQTIPFFTVILFISLFGASILPSKESNAATLRQKSAAHTNPRIANYYLFSPISMADARELAKWDVLILSPQTQDNSAAALQELKRRNPDIILLAYVLSEEFPLARYQQWEPNPNGFWHTLLRGVTDDMWIHDQFGNRVEFWQGQPMLNPDTRWGDHVTQFMATHFLQQGSIWDGVFYDNTWTNISWINNGNFDLDRDGEKDTHEELEVVWQRGMNKIFQKTRQLAGKDIILVGNGDRGYTDIINGLYFENFSTNAQTQWGSKMERYNTIARRSQSPRIAIVGNNTQNTGNFRDYKNMRFGLASALLEDGYYGFDFGDQGHENIEYYDEYDVGLGSPIGQATSQQRLSSYAPDIWRRDYTNGIALVNSTNQRKHIDLGGEFEKIHGTQDRRVNDGSIVSSVTLDSLDGLLLLKTYEGLEDVLFTNGALWTIFPSR